MAIFLDLYRGAEIYEVGKVDSSEGKTFSSKLIAKAILPNQPNLKVDFVEEAATQEEAQEKIKKTIDQYLHKHKIDQFGTKN